MFFFQWQGHEVEVYRKVSGIVSGTGTRRRGLPQSKWHFFQGHEVEVCRKVRGIVSGTGTRCLGLPQSKWHFFQGHEVEVYRKVRGIVSGTGTRRRGLPQSKWRCFKRMWKQQPFALRERTTDGLRLSEHLNVRHSNKFSHPFAPSVPPFILSRNWNSTTLNTTLISFKVYLYNCVHFILMNSVLSTRKVRISLLLGPSGETRPTWYRSALLTLRRLMSYIYIYIYGAPILDVSRSHTTTQHSR